VRKFDLSDEQRRRLLNSWLKLLHRWTPEYTRTTPAQELPAVETSNLNFFEHIHEILLDVLGQSATSEKPSQTTEGQLYADCRSYCIKQGVPPLSRNQVHKAARDLSYWRYIGMGVTDLGENTPIVVPAGLLEEIRRRKGFLSKERMEEIHREAIQSAPSTKNYTFIIEQNNGPIAYAPEGSAHAAVQRLLQEPIRDLQGKVDSIRWAEKEKIGLRRFIADLVHAALRLDLDKFESAKLPLTSFGHEVFELLRPALDEISKILYQHC
jgi:hypothetical protein